MFNENEHYNVENAVLRGTERFFMNSECVVFEYNDLLGLPWYLFLYALRLNDKMKRIFNIEEIEYLSNDELLFWYVSRDHINPLEDLLIDKSMIDSKTLSDFLHTETAKPDALSLYVYPYNDLSMNKFLERLLAENFAKKIIIWNPVKNKNIEQEINTIFHDRKKILSFAYGELKDFVPDLSQDITYVFSNIKHVQELLAINRLDFSSIAVPYEYNYNYDKEGNLLLPITEMQKKNLFKFNLFNAFRPNENG